MKKITRKMIALFLCAVFVLGSTITTFASDSNKTYKVGWVENSYGKRYIKNTKGDFCKGFYIMSDASKMYRFGTNGYALHYVKGGKNIQYINGVRYYADGHIDATIINPNSKAYVKTKYGNVYRAIWIEYKNGIKFIDQTSGSNWIPKNRYLTIDGKKYWFNENGYAYTKKGGKRIKPNQVTISNIDGKSYIATVITKGATIKRVDFDIVYNKLTIK